jgi:23S rRNA (guanine745-N1)-methyltransferase
MVCILFFMKYFICPICSLPLMANSQGLTCERQHQYDRAKEGYFNLLPVQYKNSREPGDAKQQLQSRRAFLQAGYFLPLLEFLVTCIPDQTKSVLDIGCGEGYFTQAISESCLGAEVYGIDIAKAGVRLAAQKNKNNLLYAVGSSYALPIASKSMDVITRIYAPSKAEELQRVIKNNGRLIVVSPGENHLMSLRQRIYQQLKPHTKPLPPAGFLASAEYRVEFKLTLPAGEFTGALLQMTPFAWRLTTALYEELLSKGLEDTADFQISVYNLKT